MDPVSFGIGVFGLATQLFQIGLGGYNIISDAQSVGTDYDHLQNSLNIEKERYIKWGNAWGITEPEVPPELRPGSPQYNTIIGTLARISAVIGSANELRRRYGIVPREAENAGLCVESTDGDSESPPRGTGTKPLRVWKFWRGLRPSFGKRNKSSTGVRIVKDTSPSPSALDDNAFQLLNDPRIFEMNNATSGLNDEILKLSEASAKLEKALPYYNKIRWGITDKAKFEQLVKVVRCYNDGLYGMMSITEADAKKKRRGKILNWLWCGDFQARHKNLQSTRCQKTGGLFLEGKGYKDWVSGESSSMLRCEGIAGAGKTTLTSIVLDDVEAKFLQHDQGIAFIYFSYSDLEEQKPTKVIACILKQLLSRKCYLPSVVESFYNSFNDRKTIPGFHSLLDLLRTLSSEFSTIWIFLDALDECEEGSRDEILSPLLELDWQSFRLFVTARPYLKYTRSIQKSLETASRAQIAPDSFDLEQYVRQRLQNAKQDLQPEFVGEIVQKLVSNAGGMFLFVTLQIDHILDQTSQKEMKGVLEKTPSSLDSVYELMVAKIDLQSDSRRLLAKKALTWISFSRRPLSPGELAEALAIGEGDVGLDGSNIRDIDFIIDICAGLIVNDREGGILRLTHKTAQDYLSSRDIVSQTSHIDLAKTCITYLSFECFEFAEPSTPTSSLFGLEITARLKKYRFLRYAAESWDFHAKLSGEDDVGLVNQLKKFFASTNKWENFLQAAPEHYGSGFYFWERYRMKPAHFATRAGLLKTVEWLLEEGVDIDQRQDRGMTVLQFAARYGRDPVVELLLNRGADIEAVDDSGMTALHWAVRGGKNLAVELLLSRGADVNAVIFDGRTTLHMAATNGDVLVAQLLLDHGVDIGARAKNGMTALQLVKDYGREEGKLKVIEFLLARGAHDDGDGRFRDPVALYFLPESEEVPALES